MLSSKELLLTVGQKTAATILGVKYEISICGWRDNEFILTDIPVLKSSIFRVATLTGIHVRFVKDGHAISFVTRVILAHTQSPSYMLIEFPETLEKDNMRKHERYKSKWPVTYATTSGDINEGTVFDVSLGGALVTHVGSLAKGDTIFITADLNALNLSLVDLEATVQNVRGYSKNKKEVSVSGVMFAAFSDKNREALQRLIEIQAMAVKS